jgi:hypothetical protein
MIVKAIIDPRQMKEDVGFSDVDLDSAWMDQSAKAASYGVMSARAEHQEAAAKNHLAIVEADIAHELREHYASEGVKITEKRLEQEIIRDSRYQAAFKVWNDAKLIAGLGKTAIEALKQRRDMVVQASKKAAEERSYASAMKGRGEQTYAS